MPETRYDYDYIIVGSGFGGSVSALRLAQKGYKVAVLESGRRFEDKDFAERTSQLSKYYWIPQIGLKGIFRMTLFRDLLVLTGNGVGGGSLGYANTLYRALPEFYTHRQWADLGDWKTELTPFYAEAERMLGVTQYDNDGDADLLLREYAESVGVGDSYRRTPVGVFLGEPGVTVPDPFFGGEGPARTGCIKCGACMVGCRYGAKNTLVKNYLYLAERLGVEIIPERTVTDIVPVGGPGASGADGYTVTSVHSGSLLRRRRTQLRGRHVIVAAGALGTNRLLARCRENGSLTRLSSQLGRLVRSNSESIVGVVAPEGYDGDFSKSVAISSSIYIDAHTHIEPVTYGTGADSQSLISTVLNDRGGRRTRPLFFLFALLRNPRQALRISRIRGTSRRTLVLLAMQSIDNSMSLRVKRRLPGGSVLLTTQQDPDSPNPDLVPAAYDAARWFAKRIGADPVAAVPEAVFGVPSTAHILGGAVIGSSPETGVIDTSHHVYGYENLMVTDGAAVPANVGANPSLTITALAERAMSYIPAAHGDHSAEDRSGLTVHRVGGTGELRGDVQVGAGLVGEHQAGGGH